jgi:hypothetical protein
MKSVHLSVANLKMKKKEKRLLHLQAKAKMA